MIENRESFKRFHVAGLELLGYSYIVITVFVCEFIDCNNNSWISIPAWLSVARSESYYPALPNVY
jgi:hypothetical protein